MKICHNLSLSKEIIVTSINLLLKNKTLDGYNIKQFEKEFAKYLDMKHAIATSSGRYALSLIFNSFSIRKGSDEVLLPAYMPWIVAKVALICGLKPIFVDVDPETCNIDPNEIKKKITKNTRFLLIVHLYGIPCEMDAIINIVKEHRLILIEDCAQALGATYNGQKVGTFGDISYFSFGKYKNPTTFGGGMIVTNNDRLWKIIRKQINMLPFPNKFELFKRVMFNSMEWLSNTRLVTFFLHPLLSFRCIFNENKIFERPYSSNQKITDIVKFDNEILQKGYGFKYTNFQATIGLMQLKTLDENLKIRVHNAELLYDNLKKPGYLSHMIPSYQFFCLKTNRRRDAIMTLFRAGIIPSSGLYFILPELEVFNSYHCECFQAKSLQQNLLFIPVHSQLQEENVIEMARVLKDNISQI
jgi:dTDP-4-amino-4,6-dideoxygalactose transaminase